MLQDSARLTALLVGIPLAVGTRLAFTAAYAAWIGAGVAHRLSARLVEWGAED